ncbi:hypothetical protein [Paenibacillus sp. OV219]|uniref:hypothetical protein n=1 Tax=Paenibacillus sp. OV219 TaxID=1884377 RepID=UPI0008C4D026|nr:hypothetical protein [Paenibacillus sp. OV219]SEN11487.1 hypothetical protein SAMN05518847_102195 [Paenibacillus sp. OV219]
MTGDTTLVDKIVLLRTVEALVFQVSLYLLGDENEAEAAAKEALLTLYSCPKFSLAKDEDRMNIAKRSAISAAVSRSACRRKQA